MTENRNNDRPYLLAAIIVLIIVLLNLKSCVKEKVVTKTETVIKVVEKTDTLILEKPKLVYKTKEVSITNTDTVFKEFNPKDYTYTFDTITPNTHLNIKGWGSISDLTIISKCKDSVIETETTVTKTIIKNESAVFLGASYATIPTQNYSLKSINADYNFKNKMLFGVGLGIDSYTRPFVSAKISIKL